jgi:hypothetical protein
VKGQEIGHPASPLVRSLLKEGDVRLTLTASKEEAERAQTIVWWLDHALRTLMLLDVSAIETSKDEKGNVLHTVTIEMHHGD